MRALLLFLLLAGPALGGAWPRDEGETFLSFSLASTGDPFGSVYFERGLAGRFGLSGKAGVSAGFREVEAGVDLSLGSTAPVKLTLGASLSGAPGVETGAAFGRIAAGRTLPFGPDGWAELSAGVSLGLSRQISGTSQATLGMGIGGGRQVILQLHATHEEGRHGLTAAPLFVMPLGQRLKLVGGVEWSPGGGLSPSLSTWVEF